MQITAEQTLALAINLSDYIVLLQDALKQSTQREKVLKEALDKMEASKALNSEFNDINASLNRTAGTVSAPIINPNIFTDFDRIQYLSRKIVTVGETGTHALELKWIPELHDGPEGSTFREALNALMKSEVSAPILDSASLCMRPIQKPAATPIVDPYDCGWPGPKP